MSCFVGAVRSSQKKWSRARWSLMTASSMPVKHGTTKLNPDFEA